MVIFDSCHIICSFYMQLNSDYLSLNLLSAVFLFIKGCFIFRIAVEIDKFPCKSVLAFICQWIHILIDLPPTRSSIIQFIPAWFREEPTKWLDDNVNVSHKSFSHLVVLCILVEYWILLQSCVHLHESLNSCVSTFLVSFKICRIKQSWPDKSHGTCSELDTSPKI